MHLQRFALLTLLATTCSLHAAIQTDTWSASGGAWTTSNQPGWTPGVGGTLNPDAGADFGAELDVANATSGGLYDSFYYTLFSTPTFTLTTSSIIDEIDTVRVSFLSNATFDINSASLSFNGLHTAGDFSFADGGSLMGFAVTIYTWEWDVAELGAASSFSVTWTTPSQHTAYDSVSLSQMTAVPEPEHYALLTAGLLGLVVLARRRRTAA